LTSNNGSGTFWADSGTREKVTKGLHTASNRFESMGSAEMAWRMWRQNMEDYMDGIIVSAFEGIIVS